MDTNFEELDDNTDNITTDTQISEGSAGKVYDWQNAPERAKAPPRISLDGRTVTIVKADIVMPPSEEPWQKTRDGKKDIKKCTFSVTYDVDGQQEFFSGVRVFKTSDGKYSHPTFTRDGKNQASALLKLYAEHKKSNINEVSLREFMGWLNSKPKVVIKSMEFSNPSTDAVVLKNIPVSIVG